MLDQAISTALLLAPLVVAIVAAIRATGWLPDKWAPLGSITVGIILAFIVGVTDEVSEVSTDAWRYIILVGLVAGLSASGLYSGVKTMREST